MKILTLTDVLDEIERHVSDHGTLAVLAGQSGVTTSYLSHIRNGRRAPNDAVLRALGFTRVEAYERVAPQSRRRRPSTGAPAKP